MKSFDYVIKDSVGIHARPAGILVKEAKKYQSKITVVKDGKSAEATKLMALMGLGVKCGNTVSINVDGADEDVALAGMQEFFAANL
jgi:phosphocarrier protein